MRACGRGQIANGHHCIAAATEKARDVVIVDPDIENITFPLLPATDIRPVRTVGETGHDIIHKFLNPGDRFHK